MSEYLVCIALLVGAFFILVGSIGLLRLPDFYARLHAPTKATTLGLGAILIASMVYFGVTRGTPSLHELLITLFLFMTAPVSAYVLAKAAMHIGLPARSGTKPRDGQRSNVTRAAAPLNWTPNPGSRTAAILARRRPRSPALACGCRFKVFSIPCGGPGVPPLALKQPAARPLPFGCAAISRANG